MNLPAIGTYGLIFWTIVLSGVVAVLLFVSRWFALRKARIDYGDFIEGVTNVVSKGNENEALAICDDSPGAVSAIVAAAIRNRRGSSASLHEAVDSTGRAEVGRLDRRIAPIAVIAQVTPLLGLLGTVFGLVDVAKLLNTSELISSADLMNSVVGTLAIAGAGLAVSIPVQLMHEILRARLDRITSDLEAAASRIVSFLLSSEARG